MRAKKIARTKRQIKELAARLNVLEPERYKREQDYKRARTLLVNRLYRLKKQLMALEDGRHSGAYPEYKLPESDI